MKKFTISLSFLALAALGFGVIACDASLTKTISKGEAEDTRKSENKSENKSDQQSGKPELPVAEDVVRFEGQFDVHISGMT